MQSRHLLTARCFASAPNILCIPFLTLETTELSGRCIPEADRAIVQRGGKHLAIRRESNLIHFSRQVRERQDFLAGSGVPNVNGLIITSNGKVATIRGKCHSADINAGITVFEPDSPCRQMQQLKPSVPASKQQKFTFSRS